MTDSRQAATPATSAEHHEDHGNSVAAWTGVLIIMLGSLVMSVAVAVTTLWVFVVGAVVAVVGAVAWKVLSSMGYGNATK